MELDSRLRTYLAEGTIAIVVIEGAACGGAAQLVSGHGEWPAHVGHDQVQPPVAIVVAPGGAGAHVLRKLRGARALEVPKVDSRRGRDVAECDVRGVGGQWAREGVGDARHLLAGTVGRWLIRTEQAERR